MLPRELQKAWRGVDVMMRSSGDSILIKKMPASFWDTRDALKPYRGKTAQRDIKNAILWARKQRK